MISIAYPWILFGAMSMLLPVLHDTLFPPEVLGEFPLESALRGIIYVMQYVGLASMAVGIVLFLFYSVAWSGFSGGGSDPTPPPAPTAPAEKPARQRTAQAPVAASAARRFIRPQIGVTPRDDA